MVTEHRKSSPSLRKSLIVFVPRENGSGCTTRNGECWDYINLTWIRDRRQGEIERSSMDTVVVFFSEYAELDEMSVGNGVESMPEAMMSLLEDHEKETPATSTFLSTEKNKSIDLRGIKYKFCKKLHFPAKIPSIDRTVSVNRKNERVYLVVFLSGWKWISNLFEKSICTLIVKSKYSIYSLQRLCSPSMYDLPYRYSLKNLPPKITSIYPYHHHAPF